MKKILKKKGFTLIEILIVLVILGVLATMAMLRGGSAGRENIKVTADRLRSVLIYAQQQAILQPAVMGFDYDDHKKGYQFSRYDNNTNEWKVISAESDSILGWYPLASKIQLKISPADTHPAIVFQANGEMTPFEITLYFDGKKTPYHLTGKANGDIKLSPKAP